MEIIVYCRTMPCVDISSTHDIVVFIGVLCPGYDAVQSLNNPVAFTLISGRAKTSGCLLCHLYSIRIGSPICTMTLHSKPA